MGLSSGAKVKLVRDDVKLDEAKYRALLEENILKAEKDLRLQANFYLSA